MFQGPMFVKLMDGETIIEVGSIRHARMNTNGVLELRVAGETSPIRLSGIDAKAVWVALDETAISSASLLPPAPEPVVETPPLTPPAPGGAELESGIAGTQGSTAAGDGINVEDTPPAAGADASSATQTPAPASAAVAQAATGTKSSKKGNG